MKNCRTYGDWVIDEDAPSHVSLLAGLVERGNVVTLPVWVPDRVIPDGAHNPVFETKPDVLVLKDVEENLSRPGRIVAGASRISLTKLRESIIGVAPSEYYTTGRGDPSMWVVWDVWRDANGVAIMMVERTDSSTGQKVRVMGEQSQYSAMLHALDGRVD
ncbi:hypothetical protein H2200_000424 [Cladophialophora chaetospira]|uniref:Uncharacterized protein n=1 Tax=Cladophialophora chaetospira TaxID=386627 RepID=A0AA39CQB7_9EURO|nr:hypothetical protein H2200_000424 [Cladophialophora chaetospira]